jgi:hypothetical protein
MQHGSEKHSPWLSATLRALMAIAALIVLLGLVRSGADAKPAPANPRDLAFAGSPGSGQVPQAAVPHILSPEA